MNLAQLGEVTTKHRLQVCGHGKICSQRGAERCVCSHLQMMCLLALALAAGALISWYSCGEPLRSGVAPVDDAPSAHSSAKISGGVPRRYTAMLMFKPAGSPRRVCNDTHKKWNVCLCTPAPMHTHARVLNKYARMYTASPRGQREGCGHSTGAHGPYTLRILSNKHTQHSDNTHTCIHTCAYSSAQGTTPRWRAQPSVTASLRYCPPSAVAVSAGSLALPC